MTSVITGQSLEDEEILALAFFRDELPDAFVQLYKYVPPTTEPSFHLFSKLPIEIRLNIWELGCDVPKTLHVFRWITKERYRTHDTIIANGRGGERRVTRWAWQLYFHGFRTSANNPAILSTNREGRQAAMKIYRPLLGATSSQGHITYFNPFVTTVCVNFDNKNTVNMAFGQTCEGEKPLNTDGTEVVQQLELHNSRWHFCISLVPSNDDLFAFEENVVCESFEDCWQGFRNLKRISIFQPILSGFLGEKRNTGIQNSLLKQFQVMQEEDPSVSVPEIVVYYAK